MTRRKYLLDRVRGGFWRWAHHPPVSNRHEVVLALAGASTMSGIGGLTGPDLRPTSVIQTVDHRIVLAWFGILIIGGIALLVSAAWPNRLDALLIEGPAYLLLGTGAAVYAVALMVVGHGTGFVAGTGYTMYAAASLVRVVRISVYIHYLRGFRTRPRLEAVR